MIKRWSAVLIVFGLFASSRAGAECQASIIGNLTIHDKTTGVSITDPVPLTPGDAVDGIQDNIAANSIAPPTSGLLISGEGVAERVADLLIYDSTGAAGGTFCFNRGSTITISFNGMISSPAIGASVAHPDYMDVYDSNGVIGLQISSATVTQGFAANTLQSMITIRISATGTTGGVLYGNAAGISGSAIRLKNVRIDATTVAGNASSTVNVRISGGGIAVASILGPPGGPVQTAVAIKALSVANTQQPAIPVAGSIASGIQSSGMGLRGGVQGFSFTPGFAAAFRVRGSSCQTTSGQPAGACLSQVSNDIATAPTSLVFSVSSIPSGVTVTFPPRIDTTAANTAASAMVWTARGSSLTNGGAPGNLTVVYDTTAVGAAPGVQQIETADFADSGTSASSSDNPNCPSTPSSNCNANPKIGVMIGSVSAAGTARISVAFGPGDTSLFQGDDVAAGAIPRYRGSSAPTGGTWPAGGASNTVFTRWIVPLRDFFLVAPTRTTLLFPFVSTVGGFNTGISVVNVCQDTVGSAGNSVYGTYENSACNQTAGITLFFFGSSPADQAPVRTSISTEFAIGGTNVTSACRGLDSNGRLAPGSVFSCSAAALLPLLNGSPRSFEGYVIAIAGFNNAHGFSAQFDAKGTPYGASIALVMANSNRPAGSEFLSH
jgi:hypothetical protein